MSDYRLYQAIREKAEEARKAFEDAQVVPPPVAEGASS